MSGLLSFGDNARVVADVVGEASTNAAVANRTCFLMILIPQVEQEISYRKIQVYCSWYHRAPIKNNSGSQPTICGPLLLQSSEILK